MQDLILSVDLKTFLLLSAIVIVVVDLFVFGSYSWLTVFAMSEVIVAGLVYFGVVSELNNILIVLGVVFIALLTILWKPLKRLQNSFSTEDNSSDMIGMEVATTEDVTLTTGKIRYSSIDWNARLQSDSDEMIPTGKNVIITAVTGTTMKVKLKEI